MKPSLLLLAGLLSALPALADPLPAAERTVILLSLDGFPAWMWNDPTTPVPHLRQLAAEGARAEAMTVSNPSVTWINHTTLVTGVSPRRHGVLFNGLLVRGQDGMPGIEQWRDKAELVHVPTLYDLAHQAGLTTAEVDWVAILNSGTIDYEFLERPKPGGLIERELVESGRVPAESIQRFSKGANIAFRDLIWTQAAIHIVKEHHPNLLLFHLLTADALNHAYGPGSTASYAAYGYVDSLVGELMRAVEEAGMKEKVTWLVTTDHGFKKVRRVIDLNLALAQAGVTGAHAVPQGGLAFIYTMGAGDKAETLAKGEAGLRRAGRRGSDPPGRRRAEIRHAYPGGESRHGRPHPVSERWLCLSEEPHDGAGSRYEKLPRHAWLPGQRSGAGGDLLSSRVTGLRRA